MKIDSSDFFEVCLTTNYTVKTITLQIYIYHPLLTHLLRLIWLMDKFMG